MSMIDVTTNAVAHHAADQHVREGMVETGKAGRPDCAGNSVSKNLHQTTIVVFIGYYCGQRPCFNAVPRRKRRSAIEKVAATFSSSWTPTLGDFLERGYDDRAINERFSTQDSGFPRAVVMLRSSEQIKGQ